VVLFIGVWGQIQISEGFETGLPTSYTTTTSYTLGSGTWTGQSNGVIRGTTGVNSGTYSCQLRSQVGSYITSPNIPTGGVSTVTFYASISTGSGSSLQVNFSTDGGASWTPATGSPFSLTTTTSYKTATINSSASNILVQFYRTNATVYIDDILITANIAIPTITVSPVTLTNLNYIFSAGPSTSQSYNLSGINLTGAPGSLLVSGSANYEVSTDNTTFTNTVNVSFTTSTLASTPIYVRLKSGLSAGNYNAEIISNAGGGATTQNVTCSGTVNISTITVSPVTLSGFSYIFGAGPSTELTFTVSGVYLTSDVTLTAPTDFEISTTTGAGFNTSLTLVPTSNTLAAKTIYVRLKSGLAIGTYTTEIINCTATNATTKTITCSGNVTGSVLSDVLSIASTEATTISSLINDNAPLTSTNGVQIWQFKVRDGGATLNDVDALPTIVNNITFTTGASGNTVSDWSTAIKTAALFDGATFIGTASSITATNINFTGLNYSVADNSEKTLSLRISLNCGIGANVDGDKFTFRISNTNITVTGTSSSFTTFTSQASATTGANIISIVATQLVFVQQPSSTGLNTIMVPAVTVKATDACGNLDLQFTGSVSISSTGTMTGSPISTTAVAGVATFNTITHTVIGTSINLTATSSGLVSVTSNNFDISTVTVLQPGDFAILAVNTYADGVGSADEISFVCFKDLMPGTTIYFTDNGYERVTAGLWGNTEGVVSMTRINSTLLKGTIITIHSINGGINDGTDFTVYTCGSVDANWNKGAVSSATYYFDLNSDDQVWFMQGGTWGNLNTGNHDATYTGGNVLYGWTDIDWKTAPNYASTKGSTIYPGMNCFTTNVNNLVSGNSFVKFDDPDAIDFSNLTRAKLDWIAIINETSNWDYYTSDALYDAGGYDYLNSTACPAMTIVANTYIDGKWTGGKNINWFECENWNTFVIPDENVNVLIPSTGVTNEPTIGDPTVNSFTTAECNSIEIQSGRTLTMNHANSRLDVYGNIIYNGTFSATNGIVNILLGNNTLTTSNTNIMSFFNLCMNKTASANTFTLGYNIQVTNTLILTRGILTTGSNKVIVSNTATTAITGHSTSSFINGNLRRNVASTGSYDFPVGSISQYEASNINLVSSSGLSYIDSKFTNPHSTSIDITSLGLLISSTPVTTLLDYGFWTIAPDAGTYNYDVTITSRGHTNGGTVASQHTIVKRANNTVDWATYQSNHSNLTQVGTGSSPITAVLSGLTTFCDFAIARSSIAFPLPVELTMFTGKSLNKQVLLNWQTASETNNDYFEVFKSKDLSYFEKLGTVAGAGNSNSINVYSFIDENPYTGNNYYKLKQVDFDGNYSESNIILVKFQNAGNINIYYNNENNVVVSNSSNKIDNIEITDVTGKIITSLINNSEESQIQINVGNITPGIYFVKVICNNETTVRKIFIE
jgi:hypothetical protein